MRIAIMCIWAACLLMACKESARDKAARFYKANRQALSAQQDINHFKLQLAYLPQAATMQEGEKNTGTESEYYRFRLQVQCPPNAAQVSGNKTALFYGIDTLFAGGGNHAGIYPVSVEPVITGNSRLYEYLIVFAKKDLQKDQRLEIIFLDRLFTNTKMNFVFDRKKIDEIDLLHS